MRRPQQSRSETSAERLLDASADLLVEGGLAAVTVAAVSERSGVSNGSLYHRFGDRSGLLAALQTREQASMIEATRLAFADVDLVEDPAVAATALAAAALEIFARHRAVMRAFLVELADDADVAARNDAAREAIRVVVTGWLRTRLGADERAADEAFALLYALGLSHALLGAAHLGPDAVARAVLGVARPT